MKGSVCLCVAARPTLSVLWFVVYFAECSWARREFSFSSWMSQWSTSHVALKVLRGFWNHSQAQYTPHDISSPVEHPFSGKCFVSNLTEYITMRGFYVNPLTPPPTQVTERRLPAATVSFVFCFFTTFNHPLHWLNLELAAGSCFKAW